MCITDASDGLRSLLWLSIALVGLLLLTRLLVPFMRRNNKSRSLTDLKSLARSYVTFQEDADTSRAKSFTSQKKKRECISSINFRYALAIGSVASLRMNLAADPQNPRNFKILQVQLSACPERLSEKCLTGVLRLFL